MLTYYGQAMLGLNKWNLEIRQHYYIFQSIWTSLGLWVHVLYYMSMIHQWHALIFATVMQLLTIVKMYDFASMPGSHSAQYNTYFNKHIRQSFVNDVLTSFVCHVNPIRVVYVTCLILFLIIYLYSWNNLTGYKMECQFKW